MATIQDAIKRLIYQFSSTGADKVAADNNMVADSQNKLAVSAQTTSKASLDLEKSFANLERRFDTTIRAQQDYDKVQTQVNAAVRQHPELQDRANNVLALAKEHFDKATGSGDAFSKIMDKGRESLAGFALEGGPVGALLGSFGPWGVAAAAGVGLVSAALEYMKVNAEKTGDASSSLQRFADNTGLTVTQVRGLNEAGSELGVASDLVSASVQKFTQNLAEARRGGGELYDQLRVIDGQLADDISSTHSGAEALDILSKAYNSTTDATTRAALARAAFGKGGASVGGILGVVGDAGGVDQYSAAVQKALGVTDEWTKHVADLRNENKSLEEDLKLIESSVYTESTLERQNRFLKTQIEIAKAVAGSLKGGGDPNFAGGIAGTGEFGDNATLAAALGKGVDSKPFATGGDPVADVAATDAAKNATSGLAQAQRDNLDSATKMAAASSTLVSSLGSAATAAEREQARIDALTVSFQAGKLGADDYSRALSANPDVASASAATQSLKEQNDLAAAGLVSMRGKSALQQADAQAEIVEDQRRIAAAQAYDKVLKETGDKKEAANRAAEVSRSYDAAAFQAHEKIAGILDQIHEKNLAWQQDMLGVSRAAMATADAAQKTAEAFENAARAAEDARAAMPGSTFAGADQNYGNFSVTAGKQYTSGGGSLVFGATLSSSQAIDAALAKGGIDAAIAAAQKGSPGGLGTAATGPDIQAVASLYDLKNAGTSSDASKIANLNQEMSFLKSQPLTVDVAKQMVTLQQSIDQLAKSTDSLNATNQAALSPYYDQDPRTSHIGFRSQGMASGGEFTVPGGYSANDNMLGTIPLASGEIVSVRRPGESSGGSSVINVVNHINVTSNVDDKTINAIGRTAYQNTQNAARQLRAGSQ